MTQEEKARRYDEAIKKAESLYKAAEPMSGCNVIIETLFPELKESDDERIREALKEYFVNSFKNNGVAAICGVHIKDALAWLEKQGEHAKFLSKIQVGDKVTRNKDGVLVNLSQLNRVAKKDEKQGEQKPNPCDGCINRKGCINCENGELRETELKPADKVEPKFKKGQWIVWQGKYYKVNYNGCGYELIDQEGLSTSLEYGTIDENAHLWDITKDAKDGDVLVYEGEIFMIKSYALWYKIVYHCCYDGKILHKHSIYDSLGKEDFDKVHPATKEERTLLFSKMKEAGYEWDADKKELKKIEQNPAIIDIDKMVNDYANNNEPGNEEFGKPVNCMVRAYRQGLNDAIRKVEQNSLWSEEDEERLQSCLNILQAKGIMGVTDTINTKWLKSLKERVQPKQE